ncbi:hypothetical protein BDZ89DRAFT_1160710 [Hymenopellis radicata]|nr:hypothetical protein BDZ89DRAFT_1160710 [Hymenopellis radicata]
MLPYIRRRTFGCVVISHHANYDLPVGVARHGIRNSLHNLHNVLSHTPKIAENIRVLHLREPMKTYSPLVVSQHVILPQLLRHILEMTNLQRIILERLNFWVMSDPSALSRALRRCTFRLDTLQIKNCVMSLDDLMTILHAVVDVQFLNLRILRFGELESFDDRDEVTVGCRDPVLIDFDDMAVDNKRLKVRKEKAKEFLCVDALRLHLVSNADHSFVDFLGSEKYSPLCDVRVLEIEHMTGGQNLLNRLNQLLVRTSQYLEELTIFRASISHHFIFGSCISLTHISTFKVWTRIVCHRNWSFNGPWEWTYEQQRFIKLYATSLEHIPKTSKLRELVVSLVIDIVDINTMPRVERRIWGTLDAALTANNLKEILETLVLNVYVMPKANLAQIGEITEQYMADFEDWVLAECLPATRRTYFERDERGVIFCENTREMSRGASSDDQLSRLVELCSPTKTGN